MGIEAKDILPFVGQGLKQVAALFGPLPGAIAEFAVDLTTFGIDSALNGTDPIAVAQEVEDRCADLVERIKVGIT